MSGNPKETQEHARNDIEFSQKIRTGDPAAFKEFVLQYQKGIFRFAYGFLQNREEALEIMQETFVRAYEKMGSWREGSSLGAWLYRISKNLCIDHYRRHHWKGKMTHPLEGIPETKVSSLWPGNDALKQHSLLQQVRLSVAELSARQRAVFILRHVEGKKLEEIALQLGTTLGTVKTLHHRAIRKLRRILGPRLSGGKHENV